MTTPRTDAAPCCAHTKVIYKRINHEGGTCSDSWICQDCNHNFWPQAFSEIVKKKLETELIALQDENKTFRAAQKACETCDTEIFDKAIKERDQLLATVEEMQKKLGMQKDALVRAEATVEGLKDILQEIKRENSATYREAAEIGYSDGMWIKPSISTKIEQALQFFPPTNLVKRSVLEKQ